MEVVWLLAGVALGAAIGGAVAWAVLRGKAQAAEARYEEHKRLQEETARRLEEAAEAKYREARRMQEEMDRKLQDTFASLASRALATNNEAFLQLARESLRSQLTQAQGDLDLRTQAVEGLVKPLAEELKRMEMERQTAYGGLKQQTESLAKGQASLERETHGLVQALRSPQVRGRWGELTLRRVAELAGMVPYCDFVEQASIQGDGRDRRPDMVVSLPNDRRVAVDAKTPLSAYLDAQEAPSEGERAAALKRHARQVRERARELGSKAYWEGLGYSPEFVVLFLPGETFLNAALQEDPHLMEETMAGGVIIATPATLVSLLRAVAFGWRERQVEENARKISDLGREMYDRIITWTGHLKQVGDALEKAVKAHNDAVGSLEGRVLVSARRLKEMGAGGERDVPELGTVDVKARGLSSRGAGNGEETPV
ncbi:MAG: DNA recombination protein RmuC [Chloroflexi bacterium]|nr:DNA recombination protein RmuC [Chloroflexota bacterium]